MSMLGKHKVQVDVSSLADGDSIAAYLVSATGALIDSVTIGGNEHLRTASAAEHAEDSAHASGDYGTQVLAVRADAEGSLVSADGDYAPLQVDANGRLKVVADIDLNADFVYAEDVAHTTGDLGAFVLAVRQDTLSSLSSADGDYTPFKVNADGELYTHDADALAELQAISADTGNILTDTTAIAASVASIDASTTTIAGDTTSIDATLTALSKAEDAAHSSGDQGIMSLAVRNDTPGSLVSADGDYAPLQVDATGNLRIAGSVTVGGTFAEDSAHTSADVGIHALAVRKDAQGTNTSADGDYASLLTWSEGSLKVVDLSNGSVLQQSVDVTDTAASLVTALSNRKSLLIQNNGNKSIWVGSATVTSSGATRGIEIPPQANMELKLGPAVALYAIAGTGNTVSVNLLEMA